MDLGIDRFQRVIQYFWDPEPRNTESMNSIWVLGNEYPPLQHPPPFPVPSPITSAATSPPGSPSRVPNNGSNKNNNSLPASFSNVASAWANDDSTDPLWPPEFLDDFESRIWMTYRQDFKPIPKREDTEMNLTTRFRTHFMTEKDGFVSDVGWGCMIRSAQSLLANTLVRIRLGREWRRGQKTEEEKAILNLFADDPRAPYSLHKFVQHGEAACGKHPGQWFGPSAAARCIQALCDESAAPDLQVFFGGDGADVYEDAFLRTAKKSGTFKPTLLLVSIMLGIDRITPIYHEALKASLTMPYSIGIAGGRPSSSHYFVAVQGDYFYYLDPHFTRTALKHYADPAEMTQEEVDSCHTRRLRRLHVKEMDPSMLLAFLIKDEKEWHNWRRGVEEVQGKRIIHVGDKAPPPIPGRSEAVEEVESFDDSEDEDGGL